MTEKQRQLVAVLAPLALLVGVLVPQAADGGFASPSLWWGVVTGILIALIAVAVGRRLKRNRAGTDM